MKIFNYEIPGDKLDHYWGGYFMFPIISLIVPLNISLLICFTIAILKEVVRDYLLKKGTADVYDALATISGSLTAYLVFLKLLN